MSLDHAMGPDEPVEIWSCEAEVSTLGSMLLSERAAEELTALLVTEDFHRPAHRLIFRAMKAIVQGRKPLDMLTLIEELKGHGDLAAVGGTDYLREVDLSVPSASNAKTYADIVLEKSMRRKAIDAFAEGWEAARRGEPVDVLAERAKAIPSLVRSAAEQDADVDLRALLMDEENGEEEAVVSSGNPYLDALTDSGGLTCGQFSLSTAPTGEGKTTWALGVMFAALERGERCAYLSFTDISRRHVLSKAIRYLTGLKGTAACRTDEERRMVADAKDHIFRNWDWAIYDAQSSRSARYVETAGAWLLRKQAEGLGRSDDDPFRRAPIRLCVWDYAQMIFSSEERFKGSKSTKYQEQLHVAQEFRLITAQMGTAHAIMCAQLTDDKDREWIRDCKEWEFGTEFWFRVKSEGVKINKRRFGGKTDAVPPHHHHPRRQTFVPEGGEWRGRFEP